MRKSSVIVLALLAGLLTVACQPEAVIPVLSAQDQSLQDRAITVTVAIDAPGWVILRPVKESGDPDMGAELARAYLSAAGEYSDIVLTVAGAVIGEIDVVATLHHDEPADRKFTYSSGGANDPLVRVDGIALMAPFAMRGIAPNVQVETVSAQAGTYTIRVATDRAAWLVLRPSTAEGTPDTSEVLVSTGFSGAGEYASVVTIPAGSVPNLAVFAVLHYASPADGLYTYTPTNGQDPPAEYGGVAIRKAFTVAP